MESNLYIGISIFFIGFIIFVLFSIVRFFFNVSIYYALNLLFTFVNPPTNLKNYTYNEDCYNDVECYNTNLLVDSIIIFLNFLILSLGLAFITNKNLLTL